jgi:hypothetical protein
MRQALTLFVFFAFLTIAGLASAQANDSDARRNAYRQGYAAIQAKNWDEAYAIFHRLWREAPTYDVALHLGHAEFNLGKNRDAAEHLAFGIAHLPPGEAKDLADTSRRALARVKEEIGTITLIVDRSGAAVKVDGQPSGTTPIDFEIFVDPGPHTIEATLDGYGPASQAVTIARGEHQNIVLKLDPLPAATATSTDSTSTAPYAPPTEPRHYSTARTVALISGAAVTVAAGVTTIVFALKGSSASNRADDALAEAAKYGPNACGNPMAAPASVCTSLRQANDDRASANRVANIALGITAGAAVVTATLFVVWPKKRSAEAGNVRIMPSVGWNSGGVVLDGTFN